MTAKLVFTIGTIALVAALYFLFFHIEPKELANGKKSSATALKKRTMWPMYRKERVLAGRVKKIPQKLQKGWSFKASAAFRAGVVLSKTHLFCADGKGNLFCLSRQDGKKRWQRALGSRVTAEPLLLLSDGQGYLCVGTNGGTYFCVATESGKILWQKEFEDKISGGSSFYKDEEKIYLLLPCHDGFLYSLLLNDGSMVWKVDAQEPVNATPALADGRIIFGCCDGKLRFVSTLGKKSEPVDLGSYLPSSPAVDGAVVYVASHGGQLFAVHISSAKKLWSFTHNEVVEFFGPPAISKKHLAAIDKRGNLFLVNKTDGALARKITLDGDIASEPLVDDESVIIGDRDGNIYCYQLKNGEKAWQISSGSSILAPLTLCDDELYVADKDGFVTQYFGVKSE